MESDGQDLFSNNEMATHTHHSIKTESYSNATQNEDMATHTHNLKDPDVFEFVADNVSENEPKQQETDKEMLSRITKEKTMFLQNRQIKQQKANPAKKRVSFKAKQNQEVVFTVHADHNKAQFCQLVKVSKVA